MEVRIRNYQSVADVKLNLEGFSAIVGPSNAGKSAVVRAITAAVLGQKGETFVRKGENAAGVRVQGGDYSIIWKKVKKPTPTLVSSLEINGQLHTKVSNDHQKLTEPLGFKELDIGQGIRPQFASQHDRIFLITESETVVAEIFKVIGRADVVTDAQAMAKKDLKEAETTRLLRITDLDNARKALAETDDVPALEAELKKTKEEHEKLTWKINQTRILSDNLAHWARLQPLDLPEQPQTVTQPPSTKTLELLKTYLSFGPALTLPDQVPEVKTPDTGTKKLLESYLVTRDLERLDQRAKLAKETEVGQLETEKHTMEHELGVCPTCKREFA